MNSVRRKAIRLSSSALRVGQRSPTKPGMSSSMAVARRTASSRIEIVRPRRSYGSGSSANPPSSSEASATRNTWLSSGPQPPKRPRDRWSARAAPTATSWAGRGAESRSAAWARTAKYRSTRGEICNSRRVPSASCRTEASSPGASGARIASTSWPSAAPQASPSTAGRRRVIVLIV